MATLFIRNTKNGVYWMRWRRGGREFRESTGTADRKQANAQLNRLKAELGAGRDPNKGNVRYLTLKELLLTHYERKGKKSLKRARYAFKHLDKYFSNERIKDISPQAIEDYEDRRKQEGMKQATVNYELSLLRRMFRYAKRMQIIDEYPKIEIEEPDNARKVFLKDNEAGGLYAALPDYLKPVFMVGLNLGWRMREVLGLTWERVDLEEGKIELERSDTKTRKSRQVYYGDVIAGILKKQKRSQTLQGNPDCPLVFDYNGKKISYSRFRYAWTKACHAIGVNGYRVKGLPPLEGQDRNLIFHDCRRTAVRRMVREGVSQTVVMAIIGHKTDTMFRRYNITSPEDQWEAFRRSELDLHEYTG